jgi:hypothetical protein
VCLVFKMCSWPFHSGLLGSANHNLPYRLITSSFCPKTTAQLFIGIAYPTLTVL